MSLKFQNKLLQESTIVIGKQQQENDKSNSNLPPSLPPTQRTARTDKQTEKHNIL